MDVARHVLAQQGKYAVELEARIAELEAENAVLRDAIAILRRPGEPPAYATAEEVAQIEALLGKAT